MATHKPFRELVNPKSQFDFIGRIKTWVTLSILLIGVSIGALFVNKSVRGDYLNWTIDFRGGTEIILGFENKEGTPADVSSGDVRNALSSAGKHGFDVSDFRWQVDGESGKRHGIILRTPDFGAVSKERQAELEQKLITLLADNDIRGSRWSGDRLFIRSGKAISWDVVQTFFAKEGLELKPWATEDIEAFANPVEGTGEFSTQFSIRGVGTQYQKLIQAELGDGLVVNIIQVDGVGAKAGAKLRNDGIKSLFYVMALIMLYLAFRFDIRFAPGAVVALLHDALLVVGVFAITWQPVSLTTVAALLTVIGYSVNDSVVIFDRIRENIGRLKDKTFARIINISLNETMTRTLMTSITLFVVTLMMNVFGTGLVRNFAFAMNIGVIVGVYSSVFIASPVALFIHNKWFASKRKSSGKSKGSGRHKTKTSPPPKPRVKLEPDRKLAIDSDDDSEAGSDKNKNPAPRGRGPAKRKKRKKRR